MSRGRILIIEDDAAIRTGLLDALEIEGYRVAEAPDGREGLRLGLESDYDLMLLDLVLPHHGGLEILEAVRGARPTTPVIILSARGEEADRVRGLRLGADDYCVKPFSLDELLARVEAVLRRSPERPSDVDDISFASGVVDMSRREVVYEDSERIELSERETELLRYLATNSGRAVSRDELLQRVWRVNPAVIETRTVDMHIARLREKLRDSGASPRTVLTVRGKGYMFAAKTTEASAKETTS